MEYFSQHILVVNSLKDAVELFEKRGKIYSDRPSTIMSCLTGWDFATGLLPYSNEWRRHRRIFQQHFSKDASREFQPAQTRKIRDMLRSLLISPDDFAMHCKTVAAAVVMSTMYGHDISPNNDHVISIVDRAFSQATEVFFPSASIVNVFPILRYIPPWFPGAGFMRTAQECKTMIRQAQDVPFDFVKRNIISKSQSSSLAGKLLEKNKAEGSSEEGEDDIKRITATSYVAGTDTTASTLNTFFYAMLCNPHVQRKAQEELDSVIGTHRLPNYDDRSSLPYIEALYREVIRWRPVAPIGLPHTSTADDIYQGYFIPKGTTILSNIWAMAHDKEVYKDPELFSPERFFDEDGKLNSDDMKLVFGLGRRICVGRYMASATVWLAIATVLSTFNITHARDESGNEILVTGEYTDTMLVHLLPYHCSITPRSKEAQQLITAEVKEEA